MNSPDGSSVLPLDPPPAELTEAEREELQRWEAWARDQPGPVAAFILDTIKLLVYLAYFAGCGVFLYLVVMQVISVSAQFSLVLMIAGAVLLALLPLWALGKVGAWLMAKWKPRA